jgi:two-component system catabolic regulation response regulator CreB
MWFAMELCSATTRAWEIMLPAATRTQTCVDWPIQVLLVEDDFESAELVQIGLNDASDQQFRVEWSPNLLHAMTRLCEPGIEVVLLDLGLPELGGYRSFRAIESVAGNRLPIVILTSDESSLSKELTLGFGASDYLLKNRSSNDQLRDALLNAVRSGRPRSDATREGEN